MASRIRTAPWHCGVYALTPESLHGPDLIRATRESLRGGASMVQYREKSAHAERRLRDARSLRALCREFGVPLIINDDLELAAATGASGIHVGRDDVSLSAARAALGAHAIIGVSCYNELARAREGARAGASYVAFGSFYPSTTKPGAVRAGLELIRAARAEMTLPIAAIGGISVSNARPVVEAGADLLAVVNAIFAGPDIAARTRALVELLCAPAQ